MTSILLTHILYLNIVYFYKNINISKNIVNMCYNLVILIKLENILNIVKKVV